MLTFTSILLRLVTFRQIKMTRTMVRVFFYTVCTSRFLETTNPKKGIASHADRIYIFTRPQHDLNIFYIIKSLRFIFLGTNILVSYSHLSHCNLFHSHDNITFRFLKICIEQVIMKWRASNVRKKLSLLRSRLKWPSGPCLWLCAQWDLLPRF